MTPKKDRIIFAIQLDGKGTIVSKAYEIIGYPKHHSMITKLLTTKRSIFAVNIMAGPTLA